MTASNVSMALLYVPLAILLTAAASQFKGDLFTPKDCLLLCLMLFFCVAPMQRTTAVGFDSGTTELCLFSTSEILQGQLLVGAACVCFLLGYRATRSVYRPLRLECRADETRFRKHVLIFLAVTVACAFAFVLLSGSLSDIVRPRRLKEHQSESSPLRMLFLGLVECSVVTQIFMRSQQASLASKTALFLQLLLVALLVNPLNSPRFFNVAVWLPIAFAFLGKRAVVARIYPAILIGIMLIMPLMSATTRRGTEGFANYMASDSERSVFTLSDMDVFETLVFSMGFAENGNYTSGDSTLAIILFWVPRSIWVNKPIVGGHIVGEELQLRYGAGTANLSFFPAADFFLDFGWPGVVLGSVVLGVVTSATPLPDVKHGDFSVFQLILTASIPILVRGPLGAVCGPFLAFLTAILIFVILLSKVGFRTVLRRVSDDRSSLPNTP